MRKKTRAREGTCVQLEAAHSEGADLSQDKEYFGRLLYRQLTKMCFGSGTTLISSIVQLKHGSKLTPASAHPPSP